MDRALERAPSPGRGARWTLRDLVAAVGAVEPDDARVVAIVTALLRSGRVRVGTAAGRAGLRS